MTRRRVPPRDSAPTLDSDVRPAQLGIPGTEPKLTPDPQIDRIRDILFGPQMQTYEQQFAALREEVAGLRQEIAALSTRLGEQSEEQARSLESARRGLRVSIAWPSGCPWRRWTAPRWVSSSLRWARG